MRTWILLGAMALGYGYVRNMANRRHRRAVPRQRSESHVRNAGRREMRTPPPDWDSIDERSDESFPASDPPGTY